MRATIKNYLDAAKQRREENGQAGFSLIELIVVVAILGILVAVAIPVFGLIQDNAKKTALQNAASSGAVVAASELAGPGGEAGAAAQLEASSTDDYTLTLTAGTDDLNDICVKADPAGAGTANSSLAGVVAQQAGPGCATGDAGPVVP